MDIVSYTPQNIKLKLSKIYNSNGIKYKFKLCCPIELVLDTTCDTRRIRLQIPKTFCVNRTSFCVNVGGSILTYSKENSNGTCNKFITICLEEYDDDYYYFPMELSDTYISDNKIFINNLNLSVTPKCLRNNNLYIDFKDYFEFICDVNPNQIGDSAFDTVGVIDCFATNINTPISDNVLTNDINIPGLMASLDNGPYNGIISWNDNGTFTYTPSFNFVGTDVFTYIPYISDISNIGITNYNRTFVKIEVG